MRLPRFRRWRRRQSEPRHSAGEGNGDGAGLMGIATTPWDVTEHLDSEEAITAYLDAVFEDGDPELIKAAIADVARARGMTDIAR